MTVVLTEVKSGRQGESRSPCQQSSHPFPIAGQIWPPLVFVSPVAAQRSKSLRRDKQRIPVLEIAGGGLLTSKAHKTARESIAAHWSCKQIETRVKSLVNVCLILAAYPCEAIGVVAGGGRGCGGHRWPAWPAWLLNPHIERSYAAATCYHVPFLHPEG